MVWRLGAEGMARALRVDVAGAWYHVMNRGHRGEALFLDDADRQRFLGAVAELPVWQGARETRALANHRIGQTGP